MSLLGFDAIGRFSLGQLPTIGHATMLSAATGTYSVAGQSALFNIAFLSRAGSFAETGTAAGLFRDFEAWFPRPFDIDNWTGSTIQSEAWAPQTVPSETWTTQTRQAETWTPAVIQPDSWTNE